MINGVVLPELRSATLPVVAYKSKKHEVSACEFCHL